MNAKHSKIILEALGIPNLGGTKFMSNVLVTAKIHPDLDGTSCALAYAHFLREQGIDAEGIIFGSPQSEVNYFVEHHGIHIPTQEEDVIGDWSNFILVDASSMKGIPQPVIAEKVIEIIDHRAGGEPEIEFPNAQIQNELVGAAATLVTERYMQARIKPLREHALLLYGAIHHNSLNFLATNTSRRDHDAAHFLEQEYDFDKKIIEKMFQYATQKILDNPAKAIEDDGKEFGKGYTVGAYQLIVWGDEIVTRKGELQEAVCRISTANEESWAILNIVDVASGKGFVYCTHTEYAQSVAAALGGPLADQWVYLDKALLRKQIMPLISSLIPV